MLSGAGAANVTIADSLFTGNVHKDGGAALVQDVELGGGGLQGSFDVANCM